MVAASIRARAVDDGGEALEDALAVVGGHQGGEWHVIAGPLFALEQRATGDGVDTSAKKELEAVLSERFRTKSQAHWLAALDEKGVPCGPVHDMLEALSDPQTLAREMVVEVEHSTLGPVKTIGLPIKFSETPGKVRSGAPVYGEHTREVLAEHGFDQKQIEALEKEGAIVLASGRREERVA